MPSGYSGRKTDNEADNLLVAAGRGLIHKGVWVSVITCTMKHSGTWFSRLKTSLIYDNRRYAYACLVSC